MTAINQRIPNFLGGVSQQPDFIKYKQQVRTAHNIYPDVTFGLQKRPPGEYVGKLANAVSGGQWFDIIRDDDEKYLVQVTTTGTPDIKVWDLLTGQQKTVVFMTNGPQNFNYLLGATDPFGKITINDYTIVTNPQKTIAKARTTATFQDNYAFVSLQEIAYNSEYVVSLGNPNLTATTKYRAEGLKVVKTGTSSPTWSDASAAADKTGKNTFFGSTGVWKDVQFTVTVNATHFVSGYDSNGASSNPANTNPNYDTQYTAMVTLQDNGFDVGSNWASQTQTISVNGISYTVSITGVSSYESYSDADAAVYRSPKNVKKGEITVDSVLGNLKNAIVAKYHGVSGNTCSVEVAGNGLYIQTNYAFGSIAVRGGLTGDALNAFTTTVQNISKLPGTCKDGYLVKIANTEDAEADDYYVKFISSGATAGNVGSGVWEETVGPGIDAGFDYSTMPHALINYRNGKFAWTTLDPDAKHNATHSPTSWANKTLKDQGNYWVDRLCGDDNTNPMPTFLDQGISSLFFVRNRLGVVSGEQTVISQPADYFNFFRQSAISSSGSDPIDMAASDVKPAIIRHVVPMQKGIILFSEAAQFMLFTESEEFGPNTAQIKKMSAFDCARDVIPVDTGTSIIFAANKASYTKVFELQVAAENAPPNVIEQTRSVPEYIPNDINDISNSSTNGLVTFGKIGDNQLYMWKYFPNSGQRDVQSWYSWEIKGNLIHQLYTGGNFYTVTLQGSEYIVQRHELVVSSTPDTRSYTVGEGTVGLPTTTSRLFEACLDNMVQKSQCTVSHNGQTPGQTTVQLPYTIQGSKEDIRLVELADGNVRTPISISGQSAVFDKCNLTSVNFAIGYTYTAEVELPHFYHAGEEKTAAQDVDADLRITRLNLQLGISGPMEFHIKDTKRKKDNSGNDIGGETFDDYVHHESGVLSDISNASEVPSQLQKVVRVPIYKKNDKYNLTIKIPAPFTTTLIRGSWDGRYNTKRHARI